MPVRKHAAAKQWEICLRYGTTRPPRRCRPIRFRARVWRFIDGGSMLEMEFVPPMRQERPGGILL
jgi:hypothetical protein